MMIMKSENFSKTEEQIKIILPAALIGAILILVSIFILLYKICTSTLALDATQTANQRPSSRTNQQTANQVRHSRVRANALRNYMTATPPPSYRSINRASRTQAVATISGSTNMPPCYEIAVKNDVPPEYAYINQAFSPPEYIA